MMAGTYVPIQSVTLASSAASVTFSSIPQTYTDLVVRCTPRTDDISITRNFKFTINSVGGTAYSKTSLFGASGASASQRNSNYSYAQIGKISGAATTAANIFGSQEFYLPGYTGSAYKTVGCFGAAEDNSVDAMVEIDAGLFSNTSAIASVMLEIAGGGNFVAGSTFHLYGIKNS